MTTGRLWGCGSCPLGLGEKVLKEIREELAKQMKKEETKALLF